MNGVLPIRFPRQLGAVRKNSVRPASNDPIRGAGSSAGASVSGDDAVLNMR